MNQLTLHSGLKYKPLLLVSGFGFNTIMLVPEYNYVFNNSIFIHTTLVKLQVSHFIFVMVNVTIAAMLHKKAIAFLTEANTIGFLYSLFMIPLCVLNNIVKIAPLLNDAYMVIVFCIMVAQYKNRMHRINIYKSKYIVVTDAIAALGFVTYLIFG